MKPEIMESVSTRRQRIVLAAQGNRQEPLTALNHHMDLNWLATAYRSVRGNAAPGIDGRTIAQYGVNLVENLRDLQERAKSGSYKAPAVRRAYVPKNEKEDRPIGIPTTEDKIRQRAVAMILEPIYEQEFLPFSFGFRRGRSQHDELEYLREQCFEQKVQWILKVDLAKFFDTVDHRQMREFLSRRVQDGVIARLIAKWLKAGVMEDGSVSYPDVGTPQGGVISPLLSNLYLHEVLDKWFVESVQPACGGRTFMVRFADDFVMGFERLEDVQKVQGVIARRFARFGLKINVEKTRLVSFGRPPRIGGGPGPTRNLRFPRLHPLLGKVEERHDVVKVKTASEWFRRALRKLRERGWENRHLPLKEQQRAINGKLRGHDAYYGVTGNYRKLSQLRHKVQKVWRKWLLRRNRGNSPSWEKFQAMLRTFPLLPAQIVHSRMKRNYGPEEPDALIALVRICGGRRLTFGSSGPIPEPCDRRAPPLVGVHALSVIP